MATAQEFIYKFLVPTIVCPACIPGIEGAINVEAGDADFSITHVIPNVLDKSVIIKSAEQLSPSNLKAICDWVDDAGHTMMLVDHANTQQTNPTKSKFAVTKALFNAVLILSAGAAFHVLMLLGIIAVPLSIGMAALMSISSLSFMLYAGKDYFKEFAVNVRNAVTNLSSAKKNRRPVHFSSMATLIAAGSVTAWAYSTVVVCLGLSMTVYFAMPIMVFGMLKFSASLKNYYIEKINRQLTASYAGFKQVNDVVCLVEENYFKKPLSEVAVGDIVYVASGDRVPVDGVLNYGYKAFVDEVNLTGESKPIAKVSNEVLYAGSVNCSAPFELQTTCLGGQSAFDQMLKTSDTQKQAAFDKLTRWLLRYLVPVVILTAIFSGLTWGLLAYFGLATMGFAFQTTIAVLFSACPCALALAVPLSVSVARAHAMHYGVLLRSDSALERAEKVSVVVFDKTGTLTESKSSIVGVCQCLESDFMGQTLLAYAAALEEDIHHPIARAFSRESNMVYAVNNKNFVPGRGVSGEVDGKNILLGSRAFLESKDVIFPNDLHLSAIGHKAELANTRVFIAVNKQCCGYFTVGHQLRREAKITISWLKTQGIDVVMLTGDNETSAQVVADQLGIDEVYAGYKPSADYDVEKNKVAVVNALNEKAKQKGGVVMMVGDASNDLAAMNAAKRAGGLGVSVADWMAPAEHADVVFSRPNLLKLASLIQISKKTNKNIRENIFLALLVNGFAFLLATGIFSPLGLAVTPIVISISMVLASVFVVINAYQLGGAIRDPKPPKPDFSRLGKSFAFLGVFSAVARLIMIKSASSSLTITTALVKTLSVFSLSSGVTGILGVALLTSYLGVGVILLMAAARGAHQFFSAKKSASECPQQSVMLSSQEVTLPTQSAKAISLKRGYKLASEPLHLSVMPQP